MFVGKGNCGGELGRPGPAAIGEVDPVPAARLRIARDHVEMDVGIDHHQHQVIDPLVAGEGGQRALDRGDDRALLGEGRGRQLAIGPGLALRREHEAAERDLRRPHEHDPMVIFFDQAAGIAELFDGWVHGLVLKPRGDRANPKGASTSSTLLLFDRLKTGFRQAQDRALAEGRARGGE